MSDEKEYTLEQQAARLARGMQATEQAAKLALARWKTTLGDNEARNEHFKLEGAIDVWATVMEAASGAMHDAMHEKYGSCHPEGEGLPNMESELYMLAFMLGRAYEENNAILLHQDGNLALSKQRE